MKQTIKILCVALCVMTVLLSAVTTAFAFSIGGVDFGSFSDHQATPDEAKLFKDESVYVLASADGTVDRIIVSDWIQNKSHMDSITDVASLKDIENVKGDETYTLNEQNMRVWNTGGKDLYVEGEGEKALPVGLSVSYTLDGKAISPDEIKGKSGRVTIRFDYDNREFEYVEIDGKKEKIYVPFVMLTGLLLDSEKFSDIEVTNGKIVSDGERVIVAGLAFPGLSENLMIGDRDDRLPDYVTITANVEDFALSSTITVAVSDVFGRIDTESFDGIDDLKDASSQLTQAMGALTDGSSALYEGLSTLLEKSGELTGGIDQLVSGASALSSGAEQLSQGAARLDEGTLRLDLGLSQLSANNAQLNAGSKQTFSSILATAEKALRDQGLSVEPLTQENYHRVLEALLSSLSDENVTKQAQGTARSKVEEAVGAQRETIKAAVTDAVYQTVESQVTDAVRASVTDAVLSQMGYTAEAYNAAVEAGLVDDQTQAAVEGAVLSQMNSDAILATIQKKTDENMASTQVLALIEKNTDQKTEELIEQQMASDEVTSAVSDALARAKAGRAQIEKLIAQLDAYRQFDQGISAYTGSVSSASAGASQLSAGTKELSAGSKDLSSGSKALLEGLLTLRNGVPALTQGVSLLKDGSMQLTDGLKKFNEEGISKITSFLSDDITDVVSRLRATVDVSKHYKSYSGLTSEMDGSVKFVYKTEAIE